MVNLVAVLLFAIALGISVTLSYSYYSRFYRKRSPKPIKIEEVPMEKVPGAIALEAVREESEKEVDAELDRFRLEVWRSRRRRVKLMGRLFLAGGFASLVVGYFSGYFGFELVAGIMIPLGVFFAFAGNEPYMKSSVAGQALVSAMLVLQEALKVNSDRGHAVFIPKSDPGRKVMMFIPKEDSLKGSTDDVGIEGHYYPPLGHGLFSVYLKEMGGRTEKELHPLLDQLRTVMTSGLELVEDVKFEVNQSMVEVRIRNTTFAEIGKHAELVKGVYAKMGCPVTNSIAEWISYGMNARVDWLDAQVDPVTRDATVKLSLGRRIKE